MGPTNQLTQFGMAAGVSGRTSMPMSAQRHARQSGGTALYAAAAPPQHLFCPSPRPISQAESCSSSPATAAASRRGRRRGAHGVQVRAAAAAAAAVKPCCKAAAAAAAAANVAAVPAAVTYAVMATAVYTGVCFVAVRTRGGVCGGGGAGAGDGVLVGRAVSSVCGVPCCPQRAPQVGQRADEVAARRSHHTPLPSPLSSPPRPTPPPPTGTSRPLPGSMRPPAFPYTPPYPPPPHRPDASGASGRVPRPVLPLALPASGPGLPGPAGGVVVPRHPGHHDAGGPGSRAPGWVGGWGHTGLQDGCGAGLQEGRAGPRGSRAGGRVRMSSRVGG